MYSVVYSIVYIRILSSFPTSVLVFWLELLDEFTEIVPSAFGHFKSHHLTMHLNDSSAMAQHLRSHSLPKSKFRKIIFENTTIIAHKINKPQLQNLKALKTKPPRINRINFENSDNILKCR